MREELNNRQIETLDAGYSAIVRCIEEILGVDDVEDHDPSLHELTDLVYTIYDLIATWGETALGIPEMVSYPYVEEE